jgi:hypothetical protein
LKLNQEETREQMFLRVQQETHGKLLPIDHNTPAEVADETRMALFRAVSNWPQNRQVAKRVATLARKLNKAKSKDFFLDLLDDKTESILWMFFMTGCFPVEENGEIVLRTGDIDPIQFAAFKQAVAYKRGQPPTSEKKEAEEAVAQAHTLTVVPVDYIGASPEFFLDQGKASGLIK